MRALRAHAANLVRVMRNSSSHHIDEAMGRRWEYLVYRVDGDGSALLLQNYLNKKGAEGWEVVTSSPGGLLILKRELE